MSSELAELVTNTLNINKAAVLDTFPIDQRKVLAKTILQLLTEGNVCEIITTREQVEWTLEVLGSALKLSMQNNEIIVEKSAGIYINWIESLLELDNMEKLHDTPLPMIDECEKYIVTLCLHLSNLFMEHKVVPKLQLTICERILALYERVSANAVNYKSNETLNSLLSCLLTISVYYLSPNAKNNSLKNLNAVNNNINQMYTNQDVGYNNNSNTIYDRPINMDGSPSVNTEGDEAAIGFNNKVYTSSKMTSLFPKLFQTFFRTFLYTSMKNTIPLELYTSIHSIFSCIYYREDDIAIYLVRQWGITLLALSLRVLNLLYGPYVGTARVLLDFENFTLSKKIDSHNTKSEDLMKFIQLPTSNQASIDIEPSLAYQCWGQILGIIEKPALIKNKAVFDCAMQYYTLSVTQFLKLDSNLYIEDLNKKACPDKHMDMIRTLISPCESTTSEQPWRSTGLRFSNNNNNSIPKLSNVLAIFGPSLFNAAETFDDGHGKALALSTICQIMNTKKFHESLAPKIVSRFYMVIVSALTTDPLSLSSLSIILNTSEMFSSNYLGVLSFTSVFVNAIHAIVVYGDQAVKSMDHCISYAEIISACVQSLFSLISLQKYFASIALKQVYSLTRPSASNIPSRNDIAIERGTWKHKYGILPIKDNPSFDYDNRTHLKYQDSVNNSSPVIDSGKANKKPHRRSTSEAKLFVKPGSIIKLPKPPKVTNGRSSRSTSVNKSTNNGINLIQTETAKKNASVLINNELSPDLKRVNSSMDSNIIPIPVLNNDISFSSNIGSIGDDIISKIRKFSQYSKGKQSHLTRIAHNEANSKSKIHSIQNPIENTMNQVNGNTTDASASYNSTESLDDRLTGLDSAELNNNTDQLGDNYDSMILADNTETFSSSENPQLEEPFMGICIDNELPLGKLHNALLEIYFTIIEREKNMSILRLLFNLGIVILCEENCNADVNNNTPSPKIEYNPIVEKMSSIFISKFNTSHEQWDTVTVIACFEAISHIPSMLKGVNYANSASHINMCISNTINSLCAYLKSAIKTPRYRHTRQLHTRIISGYSCLMQWILLNQSIVENPSMLKTVLETLELGMTGSLSSDKTMFSSEPDDSQYLKDSPMREVLSRLGFIPKEAKLDVSGKLPMYASERVYDMAAMLVNHLILNLGVVDSFNCPTSMSSAISEKDLFDLLLSLNVHSPEQYARYFIIDQETILTIIEPPSFSVTKKNKYDASTIIGKLMHSIPNGPIVFIFVRNMTGRSFIVCHPKFSTSKNKTLAISSLVTATSQMGSSESNVLNPLLNLSLDNCKKQEVELKPVNIIPDLFNSIVSLEEIQQMHSNEDPSFNADIRRYFGNCINRNPILLDTVKENVIANQQGRELTVIDNVSINHADQFYCSRNLLLDLGLSQLPSANYNAYDVDGNKKRVIGVQASPDLTSSLDSLDAIYDRELFTISILFSYNTTGMTNEYKFPLEFDSFVSTLGWPMDAKTKMKFYNEIVNDDVDSEKEGVSSFMYTDLISELYFYLPNKDYRIEMEKKQLLVAKSDAIVIWLESIVDYDIYRCMYPEKLVIFIYPLKRGLFKLLINSKANNVSMNLFSSSNQVAANNPHAPPHLIVGSKGVSGEIQKDAPSPVNTSHAHIANGLNDSKKHSGNLASLNTPTNYSSSANVLSSNNNQVSSTGDSSFSGLETGPFVNGMLVTYDSLAVIVRKTILTYTRRKIMETNVNRKAHNLRKAKLFDIFTKASNQSSETPEFYYNMINKIK